MSPPAPAKLAWLASAPVFEQTTDEPHSDCLEGCARCCGSPWACGKPKCCLASISLASALRAYQLPLQLDRSGLDVMQAALFSYLPALAQGQSVTWRCLGSAQCCWWLWIAFFEKGMFLGDNAD